MCISTSITHLNRNSTFPSSATSFSSLAPSVAIHRPVHNIRFLLGIPANRFKNSDRSLYVFFEKLKDTCSDIIWIIMNSGVIQTFLHKQKERNHGIHPLFQGNLEVLMVQLHLKNFPKIAIEVLRRV